MASKVSVDVGGALFAGRRIAVDDAVVELPPFGEFTFPSPAHTTLEIRRVDHALQIDGTIDATVTGPCDRCLDEVTLPMRLDVSERFEPPGAALDPFAEQNVLVGDELDVSDLVRQLVTAALPLGFVCSETCRGLCPTCGRNRNSEPCDCDPIEGSGV